jgi:hypothetical protein
VVNDQGGPIGFGEHGHATGQPRSNTRCPGRK